MTLEQRVEKLENEMRILKDEIIVIKKKAQGKEDNDYQINVVDDFMIKIVYTGIYPKIHGDTPIEIGFPKNRKKLAQDISVGQKMFVYVTSPVKKIIGLMAVIEGMHESSDPRWPYNITLKWEIGPKQGVSFSDAGLPIRPRIGDTLYSIDIARARNLIDLLNQQSDLTEDNINYLSREYAE